MIQQRKQNRQNVLLKSPEALRENLKKQFQQEEDGDARDLLALMGSHTKERERYYRDYRYFK